MISYKKFTQEDIDLANDVDISEYCIANNIPLNQTSRKWSQLADHDSCVINRQKNVFYWNSKQQGGKAIEFVLLHKFDGDKRKFGEVVDHLLQGDWTMSSDVELPPEKPYEYKEWIESSDSTKAKKYLVETRGINPYLVNALDNIGMLKQGKPYKNVEKNIDIPDTAIFKWIDPETNKVVGHNQQGLIATDGERSYKRTGRNVPENQGFSLMFGTPKNLKFFESTIDLLSYSTLYDECNEDSLLVSMEGLKDAVCEEYIKKAAAIQVKEQGHVALESISFCVDNDTAGRNFLEKENGIYQRLLQLKPGQEGRVVTELPPVGKDWNDTLLSEKPEYEIDIK